MATFTRPYDGMTTTPAVAFVTDWQMEDEEDACVFVSKDEDGEHDSPEDVWCASSEEVAL